MAALQEGSPSALQEGEGSPSSPCGCCCTTPPRMVAPKKARSKMVKLVLDSVGELYQKSMEENRKRENPRGSEEEESSHLDVHALRDFKSSNILLDEQWNAKLSDFGLARLGPSDGLTHVSTAVVGTLGYASPEYIQTGRLTSKNDVWSYGVFLYELITGRRPLDRNRPRGEQKLLEWIRPYLSDGKKFQIILDPRLDKKLVFKSAQRLAIIANRCLVKNPKTRPKMSEVLEMVNGIVESSSSASLQLPLKSVKTLEVSQDSEVKNKKRAMDQKPVESSWFVRMWRPKLVRSC